ncbi:DEAD/DEAH box helicase [Streptacidiphilus cavernicola]|uniref:Helicase associated domain protein n=1 Tax=Streptacidiphilus cavernicola TaxID=3342716 RepID=A0ABV6W689_9ACTN
MIELEPRPASRRPPRPHQHRDADKLTALLRRPGSRALYAAACGTGKTHTSILVVERLGVRRTAVVVPTLDLLIQTMKSWRQDGRTEPMLAVCSADLAAYPELVATGVRVTSDPGVLAEIMIAETELTVFITYQSLDKIRQAQTSYEQVPAFDLVIADEAHRVSGHADKTWAQVHSNRRIRAHRRLYLSATPRDWEAPALTEDPDGPAPRRRTRSPGSNQLAKPLSMSDPSVFGPAVTYELAQAIKDGVVADYRVVVSTLTDALLRAALNHPVRREARRTTALHLTIAMAMRRFGLRRIVVFFNTVADAERFTAEFPQTLRSLPSEYRPETTPVTLCIHGDNTPEERRDILADYASAPRAILANAKLIGEGININDIDAVAFADPTSSVVRGQQALGRAVRLNPENPHKLAYLLIPVYVPPEAHPHDILGTAYDPVWLMAQALAQDDIHIKDRLPNRSKRLATETRGDLVRRWHWDFDLDPEHIARAMDVTSFHPGGIARQLRRRALACAQRFHDAHGHLNLPPDYEDEFGFRLFTYLDTQRTAYRRGQLDPDWIAELEALGMVWNINEAILAGHLAQIQDYYDIHGHTAIKAGEPGGDFLKEHRSLDAHGTLPRERAADLDRIDPDWRLPHGPDWTRKYHLIRTYLHSAGDPQLLLTGPLDLDGVNATGWLQRQHTLWDQLTAAQRDLLAQVRLSPQDGPVRSPKAPRRTFEQSIEILRLFTEANRRFPSKRDPVTVNGESVQIGAWFCKMKVKDRSEIPLTPQQRQLMEDHFGPGWHDEHATPAPRSQQERGTLKIQGSDDFQEGPTQ